MLDGFSNLSAESRSKNATGSLFTAGLLNFGSNGPSRLPVPRLRLHHGTVANLRWAFRLQRRPCVSDFHRLPY